MRTAIGIRWMVAALVLSGGAEVWAVPADFSRYEVILSRKPFGEPPVEAPPAGAPVAPQVAFVKDLRLCAITESQEYGVRVGFIDLAAKKSYYLPVGDSEDGIQVADADYDREAALFKKGAEEYWVYMNGQVSTPGAAAPVDPPGLNARESYLERLRKRRESAAFARRKFEGLTKEQFEKEKAEGKRPPPSAAVRALTVKDEALANLSPEEMEQALRQYNLDLIRAGGEQGTPLPIALTPEEDAQLVSEGVLPAADEDAAE